MAKKKTSEQTEEMTPATEEVVAEMVTTQQPTEKVNKVRKQEVEQSNPHSKRYSALKEKVDASKVYSLDKAVALVKETATTKFVGSVEAHLTVTQKGLRGFAILPNGTGKKKTILVFGNAKAAEDVIIGDEKTIDAITNGTMSAGKDFDVIIAAPQFMPKLAKVAKILGPRGMMPNPKSGTVTDNPDKAVADLSGGQIEYKTEQNAPLIHTIIGKVNLADTQIAENFNALIQGIGPSKVRKVTINATMGPGIQVKFA